MANSSCEPVVVSCARDPFDLRPALDVLQCEIERRTRTGYPLIALVGETHAASIHKLLQQGLLGRLHTRVAYGLEQPHGTLSRNLIEGGVPRDIANFVQQNDASGQRLLKIFSTMKHNNSPQTENNLFKFCLKKEIPVQANDLSRTYDKDRGYLDRSDGFTRQFIADNMPEIGRRRIDTASAAGMALRNIAMRDWALAHFELSARDVYVQACGYNHVMGFKGRDLYRHSLCGLFAKAGAAVGLQIMPIFLKTDDSDLSIIPSYARRMLGHAVVIEGLDQTSFEWSDKGRDEHRYMRKVQEHSGGEIDIFPYKVMKEDDPALHKLVREIQGWVSEARKSKGATPAVG